MEDTLIVGAGIAGLTAAIYAARKNMQFKILATEFGGQFMVSGEVLNYPGIVKTTGADFATTMEEQMKFNNIKVEKETVQSVTKKENHFVVQTDKNEYETKTVILATGARPRKLNIPGEKEYANKGVTYCSICDGPLFSGKTVAVLGGGDAALEAVDFLKDIVKKIHLVVLEDKLRGHEYLQERAINNNKVDIHFNASTQRIEGEQMVQSITFTQEDQEKTLGVEGVIIEIGRIPNTEFVKDLVKRDEHGHISIDGHTNTSVPGVFAAGDCASGHEYQYVIAAGQGCMALIKAAKHLAKQPHQ